MIRATDPAEPAKKQPKGLFKAFIALRHPGYRWYFFSGLGMTAAQGIEQLTLSILILDIAGLSQWGIMVFIRGVPMSILGLFGGVMADRYNRRNLLMMNQLITMINLAALAMLVITNNVQVWHVYASSFVLGVTSSVTMPARQALIRSLVSTEDMLNAVALNAMQMNASRIIWPTLAGGLLALIGSGPTLIICVFCYFVGMGFLLPIKDERESQLNRSMFSAIGQIREGIQYTFSVPVLAMIMSMVIVIGVFGLSFMNTGPAFGREVMHMTKGETGLFVMASGIGAIFGSSFLLFFDVKNRIVLFMSLTIPFAVSLMLLAINPYFFAAFALMALFGFSNSSLPVIAQTIFQVVVPQRLLGRVVSLFQLAPGLASLMALPMGTLGDEFGLRWVLGASACFMLAFTLLVGGWRLPLLRRGSEVVVANDPVTA